MILCRFFSRTVGNCDETEATEGLERRPRGPEASLLSFVDSVEVLADDECLLSVAEVGDRFLVASSADGSQAGSCLNGWSMWSIDMYADADADAVNTCTMSPIPRP